MCFCAKMPPYSAAVLAQCLPCEQNAPLKNIAYMICEREGRIRVSNAQLGTQQPFLSYFDFRAEMPIICTLCSLLLGKAIPKFSDVLPVLIPFKVVYAVLFFLVPISLGFQFLFVVSS